MPRPNASADAEEAAAEEAAAEEADEAAAVAKEVASDETAAARAAALRARRREASNARRRIADPSAEPASTPISSPARDEPEQVFTLRSPRRGVPVVTAIGFLFVLLFAYLSIVATNVATLFFLGFSMIGTAIAYAVSFGSENLHRVAVGREGVTLSSVDGSSVTLPRDILAGARVGQVVTSTTTSNSGPTRNTVRYHVHLVKGDGGVLDLGQRRDEAEAEQLANEIDAALKHPFSQPSSALDEDAQSPAIAPAAAAPRDALGILRDARLVKSRREESSARADYRNAPGDGALVLEWTLRPQHTAVVPALLAPLGFVCALFGFLRVSHEVIPLAMMLLVLAVEAVILVRFVYLWGLSQVLRVSARELSIEEHRAGRRTAQKTIPLDAIRTVDFSFRHDTIAGDLELHLHDVKPPAPLQPDDAPTAGDAVRMVKQAIAYARSTVRVSLGRLPFGDKVRVDLALGAEIAERTGRNESEI